MLPITPPLLLTLAAVGGTVGFVCVSVGMMIRYLWRHLGRHHLG